MIEATIKKDTKVLAPNKEHQNFTETDVILKAGEKVTGDFKDIKGLRRGVPFTYKMFITDEKQIIYQKNVEPMQTTEVTLGADAQVSETKVDMKPAEKFSKAKLAGVVLGAGAGYALARRKKLSGKKMALYIGLGAAVGFGVAYLYDKNKKVVVKQSK